MPRNLLIPIFFLILSCMLAGCSFSRVLPPPSPDTLMTVFFEPFLCGFTFSDASSSSEPLSASLVRSTGGDLLTVYSDNGNVVFSFDGTAISLQTNGTASLAPLSLPLPPEWEIGAAAAFPLFSVPPDDSFSVIRTDEGFLVTSGDGSYSVLFSHDRIPRRITHGNHCAEITSFTVTPEPGT